MKFQPGYGDRMGKKTVTRGTGLLEGFLARQRARVADRLIPPKLRSGTIVDIGCGNHPFFLLKTRFARKFGPDRVQRDSGCRKLSNEVSLITYDVETDSRQPFAEESIQVVTMLAVCEHIYPPRLVNLLGEIARVLAPEGVFIMTTPAAWTHGLLRAMARLNLVSAAEIEEHKAAYTRPAVGALLREVFDDARVRTGYFEMFMNIWAVAQKHTIPSR